LMALFGCEKVLYWMEVMSLLGRIPSAISSLRQLRTWTKVLGSITYIYFANMSE
jgi:hypothetical protein